MIKKPLGFPSKNLKLFAVKFKPSNFSHDIFCVKISYTFKKKWRWNKNFYELLLLGGHGFKCQGGVQLYFQRGPHTLDPPSANPWYKCKQSFLIQFFFTLQIFFKVSKLFSVWYFEFYRQKLEVFWRWSIRFFCHLNIPLDLSKKLGLNF